MEASTELAPLDADYRLELVPYLQEQEAVDDPAYETWGVPAEYRPATR